MICRIEPGLTSLIFLLQDNQIIFDNKFNLKISGDPGPWAIKFKFDNKDYLVCNCGHTVCRQLTLDTYRQLSGILG